MDCAEIEGLLLERAAGPLEPEDEAIVSGHLARCEACRREAAAAEEALGLAALPPSAAEQAALASLAEDTRAALRKADLRRLWLRRAGTGLLAAAAAALLVLAPAVNRGLRATPLSAAPSEESTSDLESWALADPLTEALGDELELSDETLADDDELYLDSGETLP